MGQTGKALSRTATQLPLTAISLSLQAWERSRPLRAFALRRSNEALQIAAHTPLGRLLPKQIFNDDADAEAADIVADARQAVTPQESKPATTAKPAAAAKTATKAATKTATKPAAKPAPKPDNRAAREVGAPGAVTEQVEKIADKLDVETPETRDELPIPDFDNISIGSLRARLRPLNVEQLVTLREWEQAHANRLNVITTLDNRIAKLGAADTGTGTSNGKQAQSDVGPAGTDYPQEAKAAERAAEDEGGTLRV